MSKGGQTQGTWGSGSSWHSGPTKTIRVPIALEAQIMEYARAVDSGIGVSHVNTGDLILKAIDSYIEYKRLNYTPTRTRSNSTPALAPGMSCENFKSCCKRILRLWASLTRLATSTPASYNVRLLPVGEASKV